MLISCPHCQSTNRVPAERLGDDPTCGRCGRALLDGHPVELTDASFAAVTGKTELPVVVDIWAPWCGPCRMMAPQFEQAAALLKGRAMLAKLNSDEHPQASASLGVRSIPTMVVFRGGREVARVSGAMSAQQIVQWVAQAGV
ncbi:MAG: thioredoxin [Pseudomonadota bacterium]|jgi:thioredoxin 2